MSKHTEGMGVIAFKYPTRKKDLLQKLYGRNVPFLMTLLADKLIADQEVIQLKLPMEIEVPKKVRTPHIKVSGETIQNIKILLKKGGMTQTKIAKITGVSDAIVSYIKHSKRKKYEDKEGGMVLEDNTAQEC